MKLDDLVLIDTCIWIPFFNRPQSRTKQIVDGLLDEDLVAIIGPILAEILLGFRRRADADWASSLASWRPLPGAPLGKIGGKLPLAARR